MSNLGKSLVTHGHSSQLSTRDSDEKPGAIARGSNATGHSDAPADGGPEGA